MVDPFKLMCVLAHPDDESLGTGGILAKYANEGVETSLVMATRGEHGWFGEPDAYPGPERLGEIREAELRAAARVLGVREISFLDYVDGQLDQAMPSEVISKIATQIRRLRPHVVVTFGPDGSYGHPDHIAISQFTTAAVVAAAGVDTMDSYPPHVVSKLYFMADSGELTRLYQSIFGDLVMTVDGVERRINSWPSWAITTRVDTAAHWRQVLEAVAYHQTQLLGLPQLKALPEEAHKQLWSMRDFYRAFSLVNGGRVVETDLFEGLRAAEVDGSAADRSSLKNL